MKLITRNTDYALRALSFIAKRGKEVVSVADLVKELKIPQPFLRKILQSLNKEGILKSYRGIGGGFLLVKPAEKVFLADLMEIFQGSFSLNECFLNKIICPNIKKCILRKRLNNIEKYVFSELKTVTVASLLE
jgi:Rrf2 family protein